jgi:release factor glutamine methyltransferase
MTRKIQTIKDIRIYLASELKPVYQPEEIKAISDLVITSVLGIRSRLELLNYEKDISEERSAELLRICRELTTGKPVQYIIGETSFFGCTILVDPSTLIPRQETEELVDLIIRENRNFTGSITDFGTGSGSIAIALALNLPGASVTATDISAAALKVAGANAELNNVRVTFILDDILNKEKDELSLSGIVVSNPPYIRNSEKNAIHSNVLDFEPHTALFVADEDPLMFYRAILERVAGNGENDAKIYFEINEALGKEMIGLMKEFGLSETEIVKDINGKDRIAKGVKYGRK